MIAYGKLRLWQLLSFVCTVIGVVLLCLAGACLLLGAGIGFAGDWLGCCTGYVLEWMLEYEIQLERLAEGRRPRAGSATERPR